MGDQIAILASGRLRALGTSLFLKHRFGKGYQISMMAQAEDRVPALKEFVQRLLPGAEVLKGAAAFLTVSVPKRMVSFIPSFFKALEDDSSDLVKEWGISNTTLEEVFLRLAAQNKQVNSSLEAGTISEDVNLDPVDDQDEKGKLGFVLELIEDKVKFEDETGEGFFQRVALLG